MLDSGSSYNFAKELHNLIKKEYSKKDISHVILSNYHDDRTLGSSYFKEIGVKIVGHKTINIDIGTHKDKFTRMKNTLSKEVYQNTKITKADEFVNHEDAIRGSNKKLKILKFSTKSQEFSNILIYSKDDDFVFAGNSVFNGRILSFSEKSDIDGWIKELEELSKIHAKYIVGGHGKNYNSKSYDITLKYLKSIKSQVTNAYENDIDLDEIIDYVDTQEFSTLKNYKSLNGRNIYNYYMQLELME